MDYPGSFFETYELFKEAIEATHTPEQSKRILNELHSALFHHLLPELGYVRKSSGRKMSAADVQAAKQFMKKLPGETLLKVREALQNAFIKEAVSQASRNTYGGRIEQYLTWCEDQSWWFGTRAARFRDECCPPMRFGNGPAWSLKLTERQGKPLYYMLKIQETSPALQADLDEFYATLTEPDRGGRFGKPVEFSTAQEYLENIRLIFGYLNKYAKPNIPKDQLTLDLIIPKVTEEELEALTLSQQKRLWKKKREALDTLLRNYFKFQRELLQAKSPRTKLGKLGSILALAKFLYFSEVEDESGYRQIPLINLLDAHLTTVSGEVQEWQRNKQYVSDWSKKFPDVSAEETALSVVLNQVVEPLRLECRPRGKRGNLRGGFAIATSHQHYLKWAFMSYAPARRQEEYRTLRIALSCPVKRPEGLASNGLYQPLPPDDQREKRYDGMIQDNYLYFTYVHEGKVYPEGVWVLDVRAYKTKKTHGAQSIVIANRQFEDGTCLYDYIQRYLYGSWTEEYCKTRQAYGWWEPGLRGRRGRWLTKGRMEFNPGDACRLPSDRSAALWTWGYVFVVAKRGTPASASSFAGIFRRASYRFIGKHTCPHTMRYIWATWAFQIGLSDAQLRSLAYAMGHTVETLRKMYERCTPEQKRREIEDVINTHLFQRSTQSNPLEEVSKVHGDRMAEVVETIRQLSQQERIQLLKQLKMV
ncbi:hypothetical protein H6F86_02680 [Phormidium sp. FACHB-592]|uniref:Site-specific integrase n=1 Tax=Stenomitos frigidus AS-A4 TaxID=2933935 RepID=A0ABV0KK70_9CYAN|nr:hypothetical protein [Phormidium sp. FACHB-592]MBD2072811.1 hypothetical protein [Phormidium sp. FACHB-592]